MPISAIETSSKRRAGLTSIDPAAHVEQRYRSLFIATVFLVSIPVAFVAPGIAPFIWLALFFDPASRFAAAASHR